jgi:cardiolipin synthase
MHSENPYIRIAQTATGQTFRPGNEFTILQNGDEIFPAMLSAIAGAEHSIEFLSYVFWRSRITTMLVEALCERARSGVKVRLLIDALGGASINSRTIWELERAGVKVGWFRPGYWQYVRRLNNRSHRKILIIDGKIGFTGGVGIADAWVGRGQDKRHWRDTHCRVVGPACTDIAAGFADNWLESTGERLHEPVVTEDCGSIAVQTIISTAGTHPTTMEKLVDAIFAAAKQRLWITSAYFVPNAAVAEALIDAARRGVDVRVLTNGRTSNHQVTMFAGRASYQKLLDAGVKIYEYQQTLHHSKIISVDKSWATIGSTNLDPRSLIHNDELNVAIVDAGIVGALDLQFLEDLKLAQHIRTSTWDRRSRLSRLIESGSNLFAGQL